MAYVTPDKYSPYPRVCDVCGQLRSINTMRKLDGITYVCNKHTGERTRIMLDTLNAHARPPQTWPNKDAKPQNPEYPNSLEADEGAAFNFIDRQIQAQCRYELIESGAAAYVAGGGTLVTMTWAARYLYGLIVQGTRPPIMLARARILLRQCAGYLLTRQYGSAVGPATTVTRTSDAFYGAVLEAGSTTFYTDDTAAAGLALLYAYRVFGTQTYLEGARAAASYLRNVQAMGPCASAGFFTASNSAGTARLYTGGVLHATKRAIDIDLGGFVMHGDHLFYPSGLIALELWNELTTTDGDQSIGATTAVLGFITAPAQLMSTSMADIRACWANGIPASTGATVNGFSSTTPAEYFNAYPLVKPSFASSAGLGLWQYADGDSTIGTQITSQNFARALMHLYAYEGATSQVTTILTWLRDFDSNPDFETPDNTSPSVLLRSTTGEYDPTATLATLLTVRDADNGYAAIAENGSSVYDWGAFGLLSNLLAATNMTSFKNSRLGPLNVRQRYEDGTRNDGNNYDRIETRGISGLSYQTGFRTYSTTFGSFGTIATTPDDTLLKAWYEADSGITKTGTDVTDWRDLTGNGWDVHTPNGLGPPVAPTYVASAINSKPGVFFGNPGALGSTFSLVHFGGPFYTGAPVLYTNQPLLFATNEPNIVISVVKPIAGNPPGGGTAGGQIFTNRSRFSRQLWTVLGKQRVARTENPDLLYVTPVDYTNTPLLVVYRWTGSLMYVYVNGVLQVTLNFFSGSQSFALADVINDTTLLIGGSGIDESGYQGYISAVLCYSGTVVPEDTLSYLAGKYSTVTGLITNDAVLSSQYSLSFRRPH